MFLRIAFGMSSYALFHFYLQRMPPPGLSWPSSLITLIYLLIIKLFFITEGRCNGI
ncbi:hypothetical protein Hdeb2414_s0009g00309291 [Helianthus debilis subsp. tardiflorus]